MPWVRDPHAGGVKIPPSVQVTTRRRILAHAEKLHAGRYTRIDVRFRGVFCYVDAYREPTVAENFPPPGWHETREEHIARLRSTPTHLCRLRHFAPERWSVAFYTYSHEDYEPTMFASGEFFGTPEEGFDVGAVYLMD
jgi:hypothetical protein